MSPAASELGDETSAGALWTRKLMTFAAEVLQLARTRETRLTTLQSTLQDIARLSGDALEVKRTSVWRIRDQTLDCSVLIEDGVLAPAESLAGMRIPLASCPEYLARLHEPFPVAIDDVRDDPACAGLRSYLTRNGVGALLDVPLTVGGELLGVVCHEHVGGLRHWSPEEASFSNLVATVVTGQLEVERRLRAELRAAGSEARYAHLVESLPVVVYAFDVRTGKLDYLSPNIVELGGLTTEAWMKLGGVGAWVACIEHADRGPVIMRFQDPAAENFDPDVTYRIHLPDGTRRFIRDRCAIVRDRLGRPVSLHGMLADVTAEQEAQILTREHARRLQELLANTELGAVSLDLGGIVRSANQAFLETVGRTSASVVGSDWFETVVAPRDRLRARAAFDEDVQRGRFTPKTEIAISTAAGEERRVVWTSTALRGADQKVEGVTCLGFDVTDRDRQVAGAHHAHRLESLGQLAAGVAHDFNNLLQVISSTASELEDLVDQRGTEALRDHAAAVDQAQKLVRSLLAFARRETASAGTSLVDSQISSAQPLIVRVARASYDPIVELAASGARVAIDGVQLQQILLNLVSNAAHAMENRSGRISVRTRIGEPSLSRALRHGFEPGVRFVCLSVTDQGVGIAPELRETIFEPFYTSKADRGTGLGLATARAIIEGAGGFITVDSEVGVGTTFEVWLPLVS